ncbi:MAG TPA: hypothetical protein VG650_05825 [Mycobacteriales bacterium]|nr:hypothetical protein [Mycobacteriales bacterium]
MPLTREDLDRTRCDDPTCDCEEGPFWLHSRCHTNDPNWVRYEDGILIVTCAVCEGVVAEIAVA